MREYDFVDLTSCVATWAPLVNEKLQEGWTFDGLALDGSTKAAIFYKDPTKSAARAADDLLSLVR